MRWLICAGIIVVLLMAWCLKRGIIDYYTASMSQ